MFSRTVPRTFWLSPLTFLFLGVLALIVFSGVLDGVGASVQAQSLGTVFWLLLFTMLAQDAAALWQEDADDGTLDQAYLAAGSYIWILVRAYLGQIFGVFLPLALVFLGLWALGVKGDYPWGSLLGLVLPVTALRVLASALGLALAPGFGVGALFFLSLAGLFFCLCVAGRADLVWALGLILTPLCLALTPHILSLSHGSQ